MVQEEMDDHRRPRGAVGRGRRRHLAGGQRFERLAVDHDDHDGPDGGDGNDHEDGLRPPGPSSRPTRPTSTSPCRVGSRRWTSAWVRPSPPDRLWPPSTTPHCRPRWPRPRPNWPTTRPSWPPTRPTVPPRPQIASDEASDRLVGDPGHQRPELALGCHADIDHHRYGGLGRISPSASRSPVELVRRDRPAPRPPAEAPGQRRVGVWVGRHRCILSVDQLLELLVLLGPGCRGLDRLLHRERLR